MYKHEFFKQNELSAGEVAFLYFKAFPDDLPGDEIAALTYLDKGTITKHREKYNEVCSNYLDAARFGKNK